MFIKIFQEDIPSNAILWTVSCALTNLGICILGIWRYFSNNYLHWAAVCTWLLLNLQGRKIYSFHAYLIKNFKIRISGRRNWIHRKRISCVVRSLYSLRALCNAPFASQMVHDWRNLNSNHPHHNHNYCKSSTF